MSRKHNLPSHMALTLSENYVKQMHILIYKKKNDQKCNQKY